MAKKTVALFTTTQGHKSIAEAIQASIAAEYEVKIFYEVDDLFYSYYIFYKYIPFLFVTPFVIGTNPAVLEFARIWMKRRYYQKIADFIAKHKPVALINTFWMYESSLEKVANAEKLPLINVLADPLTFHPTSIGYPPAINLVFDEQTEQRLKHYAAAAISKISGWFVRPQFSSVTDKKAVRTQLHLASDTLTVLVTTGSDGIENILEILNRLRTSASAEVIVACGTNKALRNKVLTMIPEIVARCPQLQITALPFTNIMHQYMQAADLVIGKAGPNMLFESVATLTPFLATTHIAGQEDGNIEIIRQHHLGWVDEYPASAAQLVVNLLENPAQLDRLQPHLQKMAEYNNQAPAKLRAILHQLLAT